jgi:N-acetylglucosaminyldiphosphoundecaprenol N-acetyl-beta-D-mannosaminyltransferase
MKVDILGVKIDNYKMNEATEKVIQYMYTDNKHEIYTPNPEIVMIANENNELMDILNNADLVVPDGIGIIIAAKILKKNIPERVAGYDLVQNVFRTMKDTDKTVYFLGGGKDVAIEAAKKMRKSHKGLKIVGVHDGYFDDEEEKRIIEDINKLSPDFLLVGLGVPKQEKWINNNIHKLNIKVGIGVGGSFDGMSGRVKRAPIAFRKLGLEWFYRLLRQPTRLIRMLKLPLFLIKVISNRKK